MVQVEALEAITTIMETSEEYLSSGEIHVSYILAEMLLIQNGDQNSHIAILKMLSFHLDVFVKFAFIW